MRTYVAIGLDWFFLIDTFKHISSYMEPIDFMYNITISVNLDL